MSETERILGELAGAVSLCWTPTPAGVFDATKAAEFVREAARRLTQTTPTDPKS